MKVSLSSSEVWHPVRKHFQEIDFLLSLGALASLFFLLGGEKWDLIRNLDIRRKLMLAIGLAVIFPLIAFWIAAGAFFQFRQRLDIKRELSSMADRLAFLESGMQTYNLSHRAQLLKWRQTLGILAQQPVGNTLPTLKSILAEGGIDQIHLLRNDGHMLSQTQGDQVDPWADQKARTTQINPFNAVGWAILRISGQLTETAEKTMRKQPGGPTAMAVGDAAHDSEVDGMFYDNFMPLKISLIGDDEAQYNLEIITTPQASIAAPLAALFTREKFVDLADDYFRHLEGSAASLKFEDEAFRVRIAVFPSQALKGNEPKRETAWPPNAARDPGFLTQIRLALLSGKEGTWDIQDKGLPGLFAVRTFANLPFVAVAYGEWRGDQTWYSSVSAMCGILGLFTLGLLILETLFLARVFVEPIHSLALAATRVGQGNLDEEIILHTGDEFSTLGHEFNHMVKGLRERRRLTRFVSEETMASVQDDLADIKRAVGLKVQRSVLFTHIRKFNSLAEIHPPEEIVQLLNEYFDLMEGIIRENRGSIDKYIGDAIMAVFPPFPGKPPEAIRAAKAAIGMGNSLTELNRHREKSGRFAIDMGIGIATGEMISGYIGAEGGRLSLTVIGDTVNLAARLETHSNLAAQSGVVVCQATAAAIAQSFACRSLGSISIKGKELPVPLFELLQEQGQ